MVTEQSDPRLWKLAWLVFALVVPVRLYFFSGYGLGDDYFFAGPPLHFLDFGTLNFADYRTNRLLLIMPQVFAFLLLPVNDFSFVLPIFIFSLATHALSLFFVRDCLGERAALFTSLLFLTCPFETLTATAFAPDCILAFYSVACLWSCYHGYRTPSHRAMLLGGVLLACAFLTKISAILMTPVIGLATVLTWRRWKVWLTFWASFAVAIVGVGFVFWLLAGDPVQRFTQRPWGYDVTDMLYAVLATYPRHLFWRAPDTGHWMFGWTGLAAIAGMIAALCRIIVRRFDERDVLIVLFLIYLLVFDLTPHRLDFSAYYSHPRIFRYLAQISPFVYVAAAFLGEVLHRQGKVGKVTAGLMIAALCGFGAYQTPAVTEPSWDPNADGRALSRFFRENPPLTVTTINGDKWNCDRLRDMNHSQARRLRFNCESFSTDAERREFLTAIDHGYVITGGGSLAWYSNRPWVLNLAELGFEPPAEWELLRQVDAPVKRWRKEPLRIWKVEHELDKTRVSLSDAKFEECLRERVDPLRPQDGLALDYPITGRLARFVTTVECQGSGITDASGLEEFVNLETLNLGGNALTAIDVSALTRLKALILGHNQLGSVTGIPQLTKLRLLWLGYNQLESVDVSGLTLLEDLRVDGNRLVNLAGTGDLKELRFLFLSGNPALDCDSLRLPKALLDASGCGS
jgi:hypothetical protein